MLLNLNNAQFRYTPYPMGLATDVFDADVYAEMVENFPTVKAAAKMGAAYNKYSLSERNNPKQYVAFVKSSPIWLQFFNYIKSKEFLLRTFRLLMDHRIYLKGEKFSARFEFSWLPANGGFIRPHRDIKSKVLTLILPMVKPKEWDQEWGGGTDMLEPLAPSIIRPELVDRPFEDYETPLEMFKIVATYPYKFNHCTIFVKTDNSWHSVGPIAGPDDLMRKTLTVNIEAAA